MAIKKSAPHRELHKKEFQKKAQNWALDVMIGTGIFVLGLMLFFYIVDKKTDNNGIGNLLQQIEKMSSSMAASEISLNNPCAFIVGNKIDRLKLEQCAMDYNYSKVLFGIRNDYCIYFVDSKGNLINISGITGNSGIGFGSSDINYTLYDEFGNPIEVGCTSSLESDEGLIKES